MWEAWVCDLFLPSPQVFTKRTIITPREEEEEEGEEVVVVVVEEGRRGGGGGGGEEVVVVVNMVLKMHKHSNEKIIKST